MRCRLSLFEHITPCSVNDMTTPIPCTTKPVSAQVMHHICIPYKVSACAAGADSILTFIACLIFMAYPVQLECSYNEFVQMCRVQCRRH